MNRWKPIFFIFILPLLAALAVAFSSDKTASTNMKLCKHPYALCTSALCVPQPGDPTKAVCFCDVEEGPSIASVPCDFLQPSVDSHGVRTLYSTYSFKQFQQGKKAMRCPEGTPWTWCLNKQCTQDPSNPKRAVCTCDIVRQGEWMTGGGNCDTSTCATAYWSGATLTNNNEGNLFLVKALGLKESPVKWCPVAP